MLRGLDSCHACPLHANGFVVPGEGPLDAKVMVIGEAPGADESRVGRPFIGKAGKLLDDLLQLMQLKRSEVYVTNSVKHWTGRGNPTPLKKHLLPCLPWLQSEIQQVNPEVLLLLGKTAAENLLGKTDMRGVHGQGRWVDVMGRERLVYCMYHPAAGLHNPLLLPVIRKDFAQARLGTVVGRSSVTSVLVNDLSQYKAPGSTFAFDLETTSLDVDSCDIVMAGVSEDGRSGTAYTGMALEGLLDEVASSDAVLIVHNSGFEVPILERYGVAIKPQRIHDTMLSGYVLGKEELGLKGRAARELGVKMESFLEMSGGEGDSSKVDPHRLGPYVVLDAAMTKRLDDADQLEMKANGADNIYLIEKEVTPILYDMSHRGVLVDMARVEEIRGYLLGQMACAELGMYNAAGRGFNPNSRDEVAKLLFEELQLPTKKRTKGKDRWSVDAEVLKGLPPHAVVNDLLVYRHYQKLLSTYIEGLVKVIGSDGRVHSEFRQTGAVTGRLSSARPNLQNIPSRSEDGKQIRTLFVAGAGHTLLALDYSQIELRVVAALSQDATLLQVYRSGGSIHEDTNQKLFGGQDYKLSKNINFGMVYDMSARGLQRYLASEAIPPQYLPLSECVRIIGEFFADKPGLKKWARGQKEKALQEGFTETLMHRRRYYPELPYAEGYVREDIEKGALNMPVQGTAADIVKLAMTRLSEYPLCIQVHDELILEVREEEAEEVGREVAKIMEKTAEEVLDLPISVEWGYARSWGEIVKEKRA